VKEFGINNVSKYVRAHVKMDRSSERIAQMDSKRYPVFQDETLFLLVIVYGEATLFVYKERGLVRFFYQTHDVDINQLVYKTFLMERRRIGYNNQFIHSIRSQPIIHDISPDNH